MKYNRYLALLAIGFGFSRIPALPTATGDELVRHSLRLPQMPEDEFNNLRVVRIALLRRARAAVAVKYRAKLLQLVNGAGRLRTDIIEAELAWLRAKIYLAEADNMVEQMRASAYADVSINIASERQMFDKLLVFTGKMAELAREKLARAIASNESLEDTVSEEVLLRLKALKEDRELLHEMLKQEKWLADKEMSDESITRMYRHMMRPSYLSF